MTPHWTAQEHSLDIGAMPFYWRLSTQAQAHPDIAPRMPVHLKANVDFDYLELALSTEEQACLDLAYRQNENIGFINPASGQIHTYGASVNQFLLEVAQSTQPSKLFEIGCGAGFSIMFMREHGWNVTGIDPSDYSRQWSERLGFPLINDFFDADTLCNEADLIFCNDVFEHAGKVFEFSQSVLRALRPGGTFCFATTNSTESILAGDISMLEHQHVNMFTERSIHLILHATGFSHIHVGKGSYGNTFQVTAQKCQAMRSSPTPAASCAGYFDRAQRKIEAFARLYAQVENHCHFYVPLRCMPYLATVGDFGRHDIFDSNQSWRGKYIDGYARPVRSLEDVQDRESASFFVGSMTFFEAIRDSLLTKGIARERIHGIASLT